MNHIKSIEDFIFEKKNPCWIGYKQIGTKKKKGKKVPNCVKTNEGSFHREKNLIENFVTAVIHQS